MSERLADCRIKGTIVRAHLDWARQHLSPGVDAEIAALLEPTEADLLREGILDSQWVPFRLLIAIDRAIAELAPSLPATTWQELGRHSARSNLTTIYKAFTRAGPEAFLRHEVRQRAQFVDFGRVQLEAPGPGRFSVVIDEAACYSPVFCHSAVGYYEQALELMAVTGARVTHPQCLCRGDDACRFEIAWPV